MQDPQIEYETVIDVELAEIDVELAENYHVYVLFEKRDA
jgi:hypothetical protein